MVEYKFVKFRGVGSNPIILVFKQLLFIYFLSQKYTINYNVIT